MRRLAAFLLVLLALLSLSANAAQGPSVDGVRPVAGAAAAASVPGLTGTGPRPLIYFVPGDVAPSCGLRAGDDSHELLPMVTADPGERFPACDAVLQAQAFALPAARGYVIQLRQRDTREETSTVYFFASQSAQGQLHALDALNQLDLPKRRGLPALATWAKAQWHAQIDGDAGWAPQAAHSVVAGLQFLNVARHSNLARCRATLGQRDTPEPLLVDEWPCASLMAASQQTIGGARWFLVLADGSGPVLRVYRLQRGQAERMLATEARLAPLAAQGLAEVKAALQREPR